MIERVIAPQKTGLTWSPSADTGQGLTTGETTARG